MTYTPAFSIGAGGHLYYGTAGSSAPSTEVTNVEDATVSFSVKAAKKGSRQSRWKLTKLALGEGKADITLVHDALNTAEAALQAAFIAMTPQALKFTDSAGYGYWGNFVLTGWDYASPLEDGDTIKISAELDGAPNAVSGGS